MADGLDGRQRAKNELSEPEILQLGKEFEKRFRASYLDPDDFEEGIEVGRSCQVARSRGTERSVRVDGSGDVVRDPYAEGTLKTISPIVIRGLGFIDLFVVYIHQGLQCHVVIEIKNTIWDDRPRARMVPLMGTHRRQIYGYLEPLEFRARRGEIDHPQAIVVYPERPLLEGRDEFVRQYFEDYGIWVEYSEELLRDAVPSDDLPEASDLCKKPWLRESPACEMCAPGQVVIREYSKSKSGYLNEQHRQICPVQSKRTAGFSLGQSGGYQAAQPE